MSALGAGVGLFKLIKFMKGRSASSVRKAGVGTVEVTIDGQSIIVPEAVARLALDPGVRNALERMVAEPLAKEGIESVDIKAGEMVERIEKQDGYLFIAPPDREAGVFESRYRGPFSIITLTFKEGNKWRLHDGKAPLNAIVTDTDFLDRVNRNEIAFTKGDILVCDVRVVTRQLGTSLKAEYYIDRVIEHRRPQYHPDLFKNFTSE